MAESAWDKALTETPEPTPPRRATISDVVDSLRNGQPKKNSRPEDIKLVPTSQSQQVEEGKQSQELFSQNKDEKSETGAINKGYQGSTTHIDDITSSTYDVSNNTPESKDPEKPYMKRHLRKIIPLALLGIFIIIVVIALILAIKLKSGQDHLTQVYYIKLKLNDMEYLPQMSDPKNKLFTTLEFAVCQTFRNIFALSDLQDTVHECSAQNFTKGSIIVWLELTLNTSSPDSTFNFLKKEVPVILYNRRLDKQEIIVPFDADPQNYNITMGFNDKKSSSKSDTNSENNNQKNVTGNNISNNIPTTTDNILRNNTDISVINITADDDNNGRTSVNSNDNSTSNITVLDPFSATTPVPTILVTRIMQNAQVALSSSLSIANRPYLDAYSNTSSPEYQEMDSQFCGTVTSVLEAETGFSGMNCKVDKLSQGSLVVNFTLSFNSTEEMTREKMAQFVSDALISIEKVLNSWVTGNLDATELNEYNISYVTQPQLIKADIQEIIVQEEVKLSEIGTCDDYNGGCEHGCLMVLDVISCTCRHGYRLASDKHHCIVDPCVPNPCENGATCLAMEELQDFSCACPIQYSGTLCEQEICEPITAERCKGVLPYSTTRLPNQHGGATQNDTERHLALLNGLPEPCLEFGLKFLCSLYLPECLKNVTSKYPCRESCERFLEECAGETLNQTFCAPLPSSLDGPPCHQVEDFQTFLPVRLVGGRTLSEGVVQVFWYGQWSEICDPDWTAVDATVVCKTMGFSGLGTPVEGSLYKPKEDVGNPQIGRVTCSIRNQDFQECTKENATRVCNQKTRAAVICQGFEVRIMGTNSPRKGRVEVKFNDRWGTICDDHWNNSAADAVCKMLGYTGRSIALSAAFFGPASGETPIWLDDVKCPEGAKSLIECGHLVVGNNNCKHNEDASVICDAADSDIPKLDIRLVNGSNPLEGRVEVKYDDTWGTICDDNWGPHEAHAVCSMLGITNGTAFPTSGGSFGEGTGPIWFDDVICDEGAEWLLQCSHRPIGQHNCEHREDVGVICGASDSSVIRLANGTNEKEGRVEVYMDGVWGTICDDYWDDKEAAIVCKMLNISGRAKAVKKAKFGPGSGPIHLDNVGCRGNEATIFDCPNRGFGIHDCEHTEDAGVYCGLEPLKIGPPSSTSTARPNKSPSATTPAPSTIGQCTYPMAVEECKGHVPWNFTYQNKQHWIKELISLHDMQTLFTDPCYKYSGVFLCTYFVGGCSEGGAALPPCRQLCEDFVNRCRLKLPMSFIFLCDFLPEESSGLPCVSPNSWTYSSEQPGVECPFRCDTGECLLKSWRCDGALDCPNGEDEEGCAESTSSVSCDFEAGSCGWSSGDEEEESRWTRVTRTDSQLGWPADHTTRFDGYHLYVQGQSDSDPVVANISTPALRVTSDKCLTFYGLLTGGNATLKVFANFTDEPKFTMLYQTSGGHGNKWNRHSVNLPMGPQRILLQGVCGSGSSAIAIDDVHVENEICPSQNLEYIVELEGGFNERSGIIKIKPRRTTRRGKDKLKTVCSENWDNSDATVICRQLSSLRKVKWVATLPVTSSYFNISRVTEFDLTRVKCRGIEDNIGECRSDVLQNELCKGSPAGVVCISGVTSYRLVEGDSKGHGRAEMFMDGVWFNLCEKFWTPKEAMALCQSLGFIGEGQKVTPPNKQNRLPDRLYLALNISCPRRNMDVKGCDMNWEQLKIANDTECSPLWIQCKSNEAKTPISTAPPNCDFESPDLCGYELDTRAALQWVRHNTSTPSAGTGPDMDHSMTGGYFLYMEASSPAKPQDYTTIKSQEFDVSSPKCVRFLYHMFGSDVGALSVYSSKDDVQSLLAHLEGSVGKGWRSLSLQLPQVKGQRLVFTATRGDGYHGDIAIDEVLIGSDVCFDTGCGPGYFQCEDGGCIPDHLVNNNYPDCVNGTDETAEPADSYFQCGDGVSLPKEYSCDGVPDCENGMDEVDCDCLEGEILCQNRRCVLADYVCDGVNHCGDWSDELDCECQENYRKCDEEGKCIKEDEVCGWLGCYNSTRCGAQCNFTGNNLCNYKSLHYEAVSWEAVVVPTGLGTHYWAYMDTHARGVTASLVSPVQVLPSGGCLVFDYFAAPPSNLFIVNVNTSETESQEIWITKGSPLPRNVGSIEFERVHLKLPSGRLSVQFTGIKRNARESPGGFALNYVEILKRPCLVSETVPGFSCNFASGSTCDWALEGLTLKDDGLVLANESSIRGRITVTYHSPIKLCMGIKYEQSHGGYVLAGMLSHYNNLTGFTNLDSTYVFGPFEGTSTRQDFMNITAGEETIFIEVIGGNSSSPAKLLAVTLRDGACSNKPACDGFSCKGVNQCVQNEKVCDGVPDCLDQSDEAECMDAESYHSFLDVSRYQIRSSNSNYTWRQWWGRGADTYGPVLSAKHRMALPVVSFPYYQGDQIKFYYHIHGLMGKPHDTSSVLLNVPRGMNCITFTYAISKTDSLYIFADDAKIWQMRGRQLDMESSGQTYRDPWLSARVPLNDGVSRVSIKAMRGLEVGSVSLDSVVFTSQCRNYIACPLGHFTCGDGKCLLPSEVCDGVSDCFDNEDETKCPECLEASQWKCDDGQCIKKSERCDGTSNCYDDSDEDDCNCSNNEFKCAIDKRCISSDKRCDGYLDCNYPIGDTSDEENCDRTGCDEGYFACVSTGLCLPVAYLCNDENDCGDLSDERHANCYCADDELRCDGQCIHARFICDGRQHCSDNSDEKDCTNRKFDAFNALCDAGFIRCVTGECASLEDACYGKISCQVVSSKDKLCQSYCAPDEFECDGRCFNVTLWGNGVPDCVDGQDEEDGYGCHPTLQLQCDNGQCVMNYEYCDGKRDCSDGTDEPPQCSCREDWHFQCKSDGHCIPKHKKCDGVPDCADYSDETQDCACTDDQIKCDMGMCLDKAKWCDGVANCPDESDEKFNCSANCTDTQFLCPDRCIPQLMRCDGKSDCVDHTDEIGCPCPGEGYKQCTNGKCIFESYWCDGMAHCDDLSDEIHCKCMNWEFQCQNGMCIDKTSVCNHDDDCGDNSDEIGCECREDQWKCSSGKCIQREWLCDGEEDCPDGEDEKTCAVCNAYQFRCKTTLDCIEIDGRCDGVAQCLDKTDEHSCVVSTNITVGNAVIPVIKVYHQGAMVPVCATRWRETMSETLCSQIGQGPPISTASQSLSTFGDPTQFQNLVIPKDGVIIKDALQGNFEATNSSECSSLVSVICQRKECGKRQLPLSLKLVVGGEFAEPGSWPWMVSIRIFNGHICGGTLINEKWIITAAHCMEGVITTGVWAVNVRMGSHLRTGEDSNAVTVYVENYFVHPGFNGVTYENDIALIKLGKRVSFNAFIQPACLPGKTAPALTDRCFVTGWGKVKGEGGQLSPHLKEAKMKIMGYSLCHRIMERRRPVVDRIMTCAGYTHGRVTACHADSGGPLVCEDEHGRWTLSGVVSWATSTCSGTPTVFARVSAFLEWIHQTMAKNS